MKHRNVAVALVSCCGVFCQRPGDQLDPVAVLDSYLAVFPLALSSVQWPLGDLLLDW